MSRFAIGDVQGCHDELRALLGRLRFSPDRDRLWFVGDLVNRGPKSLETLRFVKSLGEAAIVVLGNHDLHLLAVACSSRRPHRNDTLDAVLAAPDRAALLDWLAARPLAHFDAAAGDLLVHGGVLPQWSTADVLRLAGEVQEALAREPRALLDHMYGNQPDTWDERLAGPERLRVITNVLTRMRACTAEGRIDLEAKGAPATIRPPLYPWFEIPQRATRDVRVVFGHWSTLGFRAQPGVLALDTGCVWGGALSAVDLDAGSPPVCEPCAGHCTPGGD